MPDTLRPTDSESPRPAQSLHTPIKRRSFFMYAGATAGVTALALAGCSKESETTAPSINVSLGFGDASVLNYAYALEQLEAAFYAKAVAATTTVLSTAEKAVLTNVATHEAIHRDFLQAAINRDFPGQLLQTLTFKFDDATFTDRTRLLTAAKTFEDLGVAAYNGAGKLFKVPAYVSIAGQIVSVEARHAAYVRDLLTSGSFAAIDQVDATTGLDKQMAPADVIKIVNTYLDATVVQLDVSTIGQ
ncbi:ferritin-like domain-containing protein [Hymenobacter negativus]|uniref:Ferritin-like domain-containing protein n=1 Tax=Hymenobacter negativus TaxID=2795026 RepID=A0ABS3QH25_9BACT|nr:ferritin-like domain-containing protein [Hymenobacter negativus]MBO2010534.1 ferritin-like domain-containing protein [Hymenobacter negativus]